MADDSNSTDAADDPAAANHEGVPTGLDAPAATAPGEEGVDLQLVGLCVALWIAALVIFGLRWDTMRVDYHLGTLKNGLHEGRGIDPEARDALVELASGDADVLEHLRGELRNSLRTEIYRVGVLRVVARVPDPLATEILWESAELPATVNVRANAFSVLAERLGPLEEGEPALVRLANAALNDPHAFARVQAAKALGAVRPSVATWPLIRLLRDLQGPDAGGLREEAASALRAASGQSAEALPYDPAGSAEARDDQLRAWERWFVSGGGQIPPGETVDEVRAAQAAQAGPEEAGSK